MDADNRSFVRTKNGSECKGLFAGWPYFAVLCELTTHYSGGANFVCTHSGASSTQPMQQTVQSSPPSLVCNSADAWSAPPRLRNTLRYQTGFHHRVEASWAQSLHGTRDSLVPFASSKIVWERDLSPKHLPPQ